MAMVCYGVCDTFAVRGGAGAGTGGDLGPIPMNMSQIRSCFTTMLEVKKKSGGIAIGHEPTEMNVRNWINELHDCGLIKGGVNSFGGARSFSGGRSDKVCVYPHIVLCISKFCGMMLNHLTPRSLCSARLCTDCTVLHCTILHCAALYCTELHCTAMYCTVLNYTVLQCTVLYCTVLYCTVLYCTVLQCTVLYCTVLCCTILYCTVLYCTALHCTVLCTLDNVRKSY